MHSDHGTPRPARIVYPIQKNTRGTILSVKNRRMLCLQYRPRNDSRRLSVPKGHNRDDVSKKRLLYCYLVRTRILVSGVILNNTISYGFLSPKQALLF
jgi:hypothetical protein